MHLGSFRVRVFVLSMGLSIVVVVSLLVSSYLVVSSRMEDVASNESLRLARAAWDVLHASVTAAQTGALRQGLTGEARSAAASVEFASSIPEKFGSAGTLLEGRFAFYDPGADPPLYYFSDERAVVNDAASRAEAVADGRTEAHHIGGQGILENMVGEPDLGTYVVHVPFQHPNGRTWVLDVVYDPSREEATMDRIRPPMLLLTAIAVIAMAAIMQTSLNWVLRLVDDLRAAAESVDAGELEVHLPDEGDHEIAALARAINSLIARLRKRADAQTRFVADASHELATPVAGIRGYVNILRGWGGSDPEVRTEAIAAIDRESRRMARLTRQLLEMIRSEEVLDLHSTRHDVNEIAREVLAQVAAHYPHKELEIVGPDPGPLIMFGDPARMEDVLSVLIDNAVKYTPGGGRVSVQTYRRRGDVVIEVSDTGPGIAPEDLANIFERFYRSDSSRAREVGFGLGLSIAKRVVESAGGLIDVESRVGSGTTFTVRLPRGRD